MIVSKQKILAEYERIKNKEKEVDVQAQYLSKLLGADKQRIISVILHSDNE